MRVMIIGSQGSMGLRYQAILDWLHVPYDKFDTKYSEVNNFPERAELATHFIVASPTVTHFSYINSLAPMKKPILCEKPITRSLSDLEKILTVVDKENCPFSMMYQYSKLVKSQSSDLTLYDYFRHGPDGLVWDCLQIIGQANGEVVLKEKSPVWTCRINGEKLSLDQMDKAYIECVEDFFDKTYISNDEIFKVHKKTAEFGVKL